MRQSHRLAASLVEEYLQTCSQAKKEGRRNQSLRPIYLLDHGTCPHDPRATERVRDSIATYVEKKLFLKVNKEKTVVSTLSGKKFLGYSFY